MSFEEKIMGGNKIKNVLIISEAKLKLIAPAECLYAEKKMVQSVSQHSTIKMVEMMYS
jgi:hypothetical protein